MCLFVGFPSPHSPWDAPGEYATMYDKNRVPGPIPHENHIGLPSLDRAEKACRKKVDQKNENPFPLLDNPFREHMLSIPMVDLGTQWLRQHCLLCRLPLNSTRDNARQSTILPEHAERLSCIRR